MAHRRKLQGGTFAVLNATVDQDLMQQLRNFAGEHTDGNVSEALRLILREKLSARGLAGLGRTLEVSGYNEGLRQAKAEANATIAEALNRLWRQS
ncbi:MAG: hypothetical protein EPN91_08785 [Salinibacterium sp.]|nr:MAG: hypothetical protein EPN91_08785 [Salinibacterium sp.]